MSLFQAAAMIVKKEGKGKKKIKKKDDEKLQVEGKKRSCLRSPKPSRTA